MQKTTLDLNLSSLSIAVVTHSRTTGFSQMLRDFLKVKKATFLFVDHPLHPEKGTVSVYASFRNGMQVTKETSPTFSNTLLNYIWDLCTTIFYMAKSPQVFDIAIGVDNLNTLALIILRYFGKVKKVVYHTVDYTPNRFKNSLLNSTYHLIDQICCYQADMIWNSSGRMNEGRVKRGLIEHKIARTIVTPDGSNFDPEKRLPLSRIDRNLIVFLGHLRSGMGLDLLLDVFKEIVESKKEAKLMIVGGGPLQQHLMARIKNENIPHVELTGFIESHEKVDEIIRKGAIGVAPFEPEKNSIEYYSDVGKPKVYLAAGMPVVITKLPEIADEIDLRKAGFAISFDKNLMTNNILLLLQDKKLYESYRNNAIVLSEKYIWKNIFEKAFRETFKYLYD